MIRVTLGKRVGIIGCGKMGEALLAGLLKARTADRANILVSDVEPKRRKLISERYSVRCSSENADVVKESDIIVLSVQPKDMPNALNSIKDALNSGKLLISIAAGVTTEYIQRALNKRIDLVRAMPNNPCTIGEGMIVLTTGGGTPISRLEEAIQIFETVGRTQILDESLFDAVTGLSGSGPAYAYLFIEALADGGVKVGIPKNISITLAAQTVLGAAKMVLETGEHPAKLKDLVVTPAGTTISGLVELEEGKLRASALRAVERSTQRARELSTP